MQATGKWLIGKICHMKQLTKIHQGKRPVRRHFIGAWLEERGMDPMDLVTALNESDTSLPAIDKSQVYRWLNKGQMPHADTQVRIAGALGIVDPETGDPDPSGIFRDPTDDWFTKFFHDKDPDEIQRAKRVLELAFPKSKTGTAG